MILVAGESLVDLIIRPDGSLYPSPGGGPFNAARTLSRLGQPTRFLGRFSADPFGARLADRLRQDNVEITSAGPVPEPTALAIVALSGGGGPASGHPAAHAAAQRLLDLLDVDPLRPP
ncbi:MAG TPA: PfkB family carbohydrate kinase [Streptosporangiaceae bacterium]